MFVELTKSIQVILYLHQERITSSWIHLYHSLLTLDRNGGKTKLDEYESYFVRNMESMMEGGLDFQAVVREALRDVLGEMPSRVLVMLLSKQARHEPVRFVQEASKIFGPSASGLYGPILGRAEVLVASGGGSGRGSRFESILAELESEPSSHETRKKQVPLHNHRIKDDLAEYMENLEKKSKD